MQVEIGFCFAALKVIPFTPILSPHIPIISLIIFTYSRYEKLSKAQNPTHIPKIQ